jgi:hypothetical protein
VFKPIRVVWQRVGALLTIAVLALVATSVVARKRGRNPSALAWPGVIALMLAAFGAALGDIGLAILGGLFGLVIGTISLVPLKHADGTPYTDGEIARGGGLSSPRPQSCSSCFS